VTPRRIVNHGGRLYAVVDEPGAAARAVDALVASGIAEFTLMDQAPDIAWYEAALRSGRSVIGVRVNKEADVRRAVDVLRGLGAHFINHFGWFATEEFERWHGTEPTVPDYLRR
jgi:hypothetical protein